jgi:hypothetical protein
MILSILAIVFLTTAGALVAQTGTTGSTGTSTTPQAGAPTTGNVNVDPTTNPEAARGTENPGDPAELDVDTGTMDQGVSRVYTGSNGTTAGVPQSGTTGSTGLNQTGSTTGTTGVTPETEQGTGMDVDVDTGSRADGAVDVDVTRTTDADTDASSTNDDMGGANYGDQDTLPSTASDLPLVALIGFLALCAAFYVRLSTKRDA